MEEAAAAGESWWVGFPLFFFLSPRRTAPSARQACLVRLCACVCVRMCVWVAVAVAVSFFFVTGATRRMALLTGLLSCLALPCLALLTSGPFRPDGPYLGRLR